MSRFESLSRKEVELGPMLLVNIKRKPYMVNPSEDAELKFFSPDIDVLVMIIANHSLLLIEEYIRINGFYSCPH